MQGKSFVLGAIIGTAFVSMACDCVWFDTEKQIQALFDESDYVFIGHPISALTPTAGPDKRFLGSDVLMKVQALKKGEMTTDTVVILQDDSNCARRFSPHDTLVVFGSKITQLKQVGPDSPKPYSGFDDDGKTFWVNQDDRIFSRYQKARARYPVVVTNQCTSFTKQHSLLTKYIRAKTDDFFLLPSSRRPARH